MTSDPNLHYIQSRLAPPDSSCIRQTSPLSTLRQFCGLQLGRPCACCRRCSPVLFVSCPEKMTYIAAPAGHYLHHTICLCSPGLFANTSKFEHHQVFSDCFAEGLLHQKSEHNRLGLGTTPTGYFPALLAPALMQSWPLGHSIPRTSCCLLFLLFKYLRTAQIARSPLPAFQTVRIFVSLLSIQHLVIAS